MIYLNGKLGGSAMKGKKLVLEQIDKLNSVYNVDDHDELLKIVEKVCVDYESGGPLNITSKYLL